MNIREELPYKDDNNIGAMPQNEEMRVRSVWVFEAYPDSHINNFIKSLKKLGWDSASEFKEEMTVSGWIEERRKSGLCGQFSLGIIAAKVEKKHPIQKRFAELPDGVDYIHAYIYQLMPNTTILSLQFILTDEKETFLEAPLKANYEKLQMPIENAYSVYVPFNLRRKDVNQLKKNTYSELHQWVKVHTPGMFCDGLTENELPTCEFITLNCENVFYERKTNLDYLAAAGLSFAYNVWECDDFKGIYMAKTSMTDRRLTMVANSSKLLNDIDLASCGGRNTGGFAKYLNVLGRTLSMWTLSIVILEYQYKLITIRDVISTFEYDKTDKIIPEIRRIEQEYMMLEISIPSFIYEMNRNFSKKEHCRDSNILFQPIASDKGLMRALPDLLLYQFERGSSRIQELQSSIKMSLETAAQLINAISNDKMSNTNMMIQKGMGWMTFAMLVLTVIIAILTVVMFVFGGAGLTEEGWLKIKPFSEKLYNMFH